MNMPSLFIFLCTTSIIQAAMPAQPPQEELITMPSASVLAAQLKPEFPEFVTILKLDTLLGGKTMLPSHVVGHVEGQFLKIKSSCSVLEKWQKNRAPVMKILLSEHPQEFNILNKIFLWG